MTMHERVQAIAAHKSPGLFHMGLARRCGEQSGQFSSPGAVVMLTITALLISLGVLSEVLEYAARHRGHKTVESDRLLINSGEVGMPANEVTCFSFHRPVC